MAMAAITTSAIAATMSIDRRLLRWGIGLAGIAIGLLVIAFSFPRMVAYSYLLGVPAGLDDALATGRPIDKVKLEEALDIYRKASDWVPGDPVILQDYGRLELRRAEKFPTNSDGRREALLSASQHFKASIAAAPARPFAWSLAAYAEAQLKADSSFLNALLRMSYYAGPHEASSILLRAQVGCEIWEGLDTDVRGFIAQDLKALWAEARLRPALVDIYFRSSYPTRSAIRATILTDTQSEKRFNQMLERALKKPGR